MPFIIQTGVCLCNDVVTFLDGGQIDQLVCNPAIFHLAIGSFQKTVLIETGIKRHGVNQPDVWPFRSFNGTNASVVSWMYIPHLKTGTVTCQASRPQGSNPSLVGHLGKRGGLIDKLRQLTGAKELLDSGRNRT